MASCCPLVTAMGPVSENSCQPVATTGADPDARTVPLGMPEVTLSILTVVV
jgi:hypothetical protein